MIRSISKSLIFWWLTVGLLNTVKAQESRQVITFNDQWTFKKSVDTANEQVQWQSVTLPHTWNAVDMQLGKNFYEGEAIYKKDYVFSNDLKDKRLFLRFEGVGQVADLYVNNTFIGTHKGAYSAFCFDISYAVKYGESNTITVKVNNKARKDIIPVNHFLFGIYGGIYRSVNLIITNKVNISTTDYASPGVYISQQNVSATSADLSVLVKAENISGQPQTVELRNTLVNKKGKVVHCESGNYLLSIQGRHQLLQHFTISNPVLWDGFNNPYLYKCVTELWQNGKLLDKVEQPVGIRSFEMVAGKGMLLNGKPYKMYGVSRHQDRWQYGNALTNAQHKEDLNIIREMGTTTIRFAHYQQAEYVYAQCDTMGFIAWAEIPFVNTFSREEGDNAKQQLEELIKQNYNHPSIYVWGLHNEVYGKTPGDYPAVLTRDLNELAKRLDPFRYTVAVSGYGEMNRPTNLNTDIQGMNQYYGWYDENIANILPWIQKLETGYPDNLLILSEYGADGNIFHQQEQAMLPNTWDYTNPFYPENFETKTHEMQWPIIASHPYIAASYIWNAFDFATPMWNRGSLPARNMKGLVTFDRTIKKDAFYWYKANWSKDPVVYITERRTTQRKNAQTQVTVYSNQGTPVLYLNGKKSSVAPVTKDVPVHYVFDKVVLKKGKNTLKVVVTNNASTYTDIVEWNLE